MQQFNKTHGFVSKGCPAKAAWIKSSVISLFSAARSDDGLRFRTSFGLRANALPTCTGTHHITTMSNYAPYQLMILDKLRVLEARYYNTSMYHWFASDAWPHQSYDHETQQSHSSSRWSETKTLWLGIAQPRLNLTARTVTITSSISTGPYSRDWICRIIDVAQ
jgi:hypothetical protein